jgi:hypothetical protein
MKAAKMQFGRIYGIGLIVLGIVLLALQFVHYMTLPKEVGPTQTETRTVKNTQHLTSSWPGFIGAGSLVAGIALFVTSRRKDEPNEHRRAK